jgi:MinD-like ATPase involved in chromosome partitioning or flagellar assembly
MKVCVLNLSGNVGKTTVAAHMLQSRLKAPVFSIESINADASNEGLDVQRLRGRQFAELTTRLMKIPSAIVDVGSSNVEEFLKLMQQHEDSHEEFDWFVVPVVKEVKQQTDTINTIALLRGVGVASAKIRVVINKADPDDDLENDFGPVYEFCRSGQATLPEGAVIFSNEVFAGLTRLHMTLSDLTADTTDYRQRLRDATNEDEQDAAINMIGNKRLAKTCTKNLDAAFQALFV